jgi:hypothetical protein
MVFDGAESDAQFCAGMLGFLPHGLSGPFAAVPRGAVWLFLPHLGDRLRGMGYIALHNESIRAWRRGGESALNCMDGNSLPR